MHFTNDKTTATMYVTYSITPRRRRPRRRVRLWLAGGGTEGGGSQTAAAAAVVWCILTRLEIPL